MSAPDTESAETESAPDTDRLDTVAAPVPRDPADAGSGAGDDDTAPVRLLTPDGRRLPLADYDPYLADLTDADLVGLLRDMVIARRLDEESTALQRQGELGLWASLRGQEAAQVGSARALRTDDMVFPTYREHAVAWCRGVDPLDVLGLFRGVAHGGWDVDEHGFQTYAIVVGSQVLHATGYAMGVTKEARTGLGRRPVGTAHRPATDSTGGTAGDSDGTAGDGDDLPATLVYFGDGASSQGDVNEAFNWAGVFEAPVVFFCQNNQWAISEPTRRQTRVPIYFRARGFGIAGVRVDGNDVLATLAVTRWALHQARQGRPALVEAVTYRMGAHTTADDPSRYRQASELARWGALDPVQRMAAYLRGRGLLDDDAAAALDREADALAATLRQRCLNLPDPAPLSLFDHVYVHDTEELVDARATFADFTEADLPEAGFTEAEQTDQAEPAYQSEPSHRSEASYWSEPVPRNGPSRPAGTAQRAARPGGPPAAARAGAGGRATVVRPVPTVTVATARGTGRAL
ncbi:3-methyl-2-oxobutanoate dehydrogenase (2-methylpropanoyl-transferring) [Candidatus Protofrankia datiscae]|uniref:2-oxoisovalerate dehydrogenase subunit alpha n=1 Tax=Candidatus Protofrankia datiscae TaxID=2716812 RepID=F8B022_9ACTN|nr:3-methyl-2-oxobutanoate dehydrogenase (2-methylpropanoyl-transferring) [Candidatus Protofrankia datiscae]